MLRALQGVHNSPRVISFQPAVGGNRSVARSVSTRIHHYDVVACPKQNLRLPYDTYAVVCDPMKNEHPIAIGLHGTNLPPAQQSVIGRAYVKLLTMRADFRERRVSFLNEVRRKLPAQRVKERRTREPAHARRDNRRRKRKKEEDTYRASHSLEDTRYASWKFQD